MSDVSEATVGKLTNLRSMLQWLNALNQNHYLVQSTMTNIFVEEMIGVGVLNETATAMVEVKHLISNASSIYTRLHGGYTEIDPYFVTPMTDKKADEQARKCVNTLVSKIPKLYEEIEGFKWYLTRSVKPQSTFTYFYWWPYGYGGETVTLPEMHTKYGFERKSLTEREAVEVLSLLNTTLSVNWNSKGLPTLKKICEKIAHNALEYQKHCRKPSLRELLLRMAYLCHESWNDDKNKKMLFKYVPPIYSSMLESKDKLAYLLDSIDLIVRDFDEYVMKASNRDATMYDAHLTSEQRLDYLVRAVPYLEEYIQEMRDLVLKSREEWKDKCIDEGEVADWFNKRGFGTSPADLKNHKLSDCLGKIIGFAGEPDPLSEDNEEEGTVEVFVDVLSSCFYGRAYRSRAQPRCMKERLVWLISLYKDSKHSLVFYNLKRSLLVEKLCKRLEDEHFYDYISKVKVYLHILPIKICEVYKSLTNTSEVKYGFYKSAIFCEKFAPDYVDIFTKTLLELLRDVEHITVLTHHKLNRNNTPLNHKNPQHVAANPTNKVLEGKTENNNEVWSDSDEDDDPNVVWRNTWSPWSYEDVDDNYYTTITTKEIDVDEISDWFAHQGFSSKILAGDLTGHQIHRLMDNLLNSGFSLNSMYKFLWRIFDSSLERFLVAPDTLKKRLDWIGKLDSGEEYYNALHGMVTRLREMGTERSAIAARTLLSLSKNVAAIRRNLLEDPDDYGQYNETMCIMPSSHLYLDTLKSIIAQLIEDLKEFKVHVGDKKETCIKDDENFKDWIKGKGFGATALHDNCTTGILAEFLGKIKEDRLIDLMNVTKYSLSAMEPNNLRDMAEWCYQLQVKEPRVVKRIKQDLKNEVAAYIDGNYASEMKEMFGKFLGIVPKIRETLEGIAKTSSPYTDVVFDPQMYELYKRIFRKIVSEVYEHHSHTKVSFVEDASENKRHVTTMQTNATQIPLVSGAHPDNTEHYSAKTAISGYFVNVFGQDSEEERDNAVKTTIALLQCAPIKSLVGANDGSRMHVLIPAVMGASLTASTIYIINLKFGTYIKNLIFNAIGKTTP